MSKPLENGWQPLKVVIKELMTNKNCLNYNFSQDNHIYAHNYT